MNKECFNVILSTLLAISLIGCNGVGNVAPLVNNQTNLNSASQPAVSVQMIGGHSFFEFNANTFNFHGSDFKLVFSDNAPGQTGWAKPLYFLVPIGIDGTPTGQPSLPLLDTFGQESSLTTLSLYDSKNLTKIFPNFIYVARSYDNASMPTGSVAINEVNFDNIDATVAKYLVSAKDIQNDSNIVSVDRLRDQGGNEIGVILANKVGAYYYNEATKLVTNINGDIPLANDSITSIYGYGDVVFLETGSLRRYSVAKQIISQVSPSTNNINWTRLPSGELSTWFDDRAVGLLTGKSIGYNCENPIFNQLQLLAYCDVGYVFHGHYNNLNNNYRVGKFTSPIALNLANCERHISADGLKYSIALDFGYYDDKATSEWNESNMTKLRCY